MWQLEHVQEYIDNSVVMINVDLTLGNSSVVKFGGYDEKSLKDDLNIYNVTAPYDQWMLTATGYTFGNDVNTDEAIHVVFSPDKPFLYMPPTNLNSMHKELLSEYGPDLTCGDGICKWAGKSCSNVVLLNRYKSNNHDLVLYITD